MRISDWSSDVCSSYLEIDVEDNIPVGVGQRLEGLVLLAGDAARIVHEDIYAARLAGDRLDPACRCHAVAKIDRRAADIHGDERLKTCRSEEHTSELQSLMRISYAVFCLKKKTKKTLTQ